MSLSEAIRKLLGGRPEAFGGRPEACEGRLPLSEAINH